MRYADDIDSTVMGLFHADDGTDVLSWVRARNRARYEGSGVTLEDGDQDTFIGLHKIRTPKGLMVSPQLSDPTSSHFYQDDFRLRSGFVSFRSWQNEGIPWAVFTGLVARCRHHSSNDEIARQSFFEMTVALLLEADFPPESVISFAQKCHSRGKDGPTLRSSLIQP